MCGPALFVTLLRLGAGGVPISRPVTLWRTGTGVLAVLVCWPALAQPRRLSLDDALRLAHEQHPTLRQSEAQLGVVQAREQEALGLYLPQLNGYAQYQRAHGTYGRVGSGAVGAPSSSGTTNLFSLGLTGSQVLWDFGVIERYRAAGYVKEAQEATVRAVGLQIALGVRRAYFAAAAQHALVQVSQAAVDNTELHLKQIEGLYQAAQRTGIDLAQAKTQVANAKLSVINAQNAYQVAIAQLNQAMGVLQTSQWELDDAPLAEVPDEAGALDGLVQQAVAARPELVSLRKQEAQYAALQLAAVGAYFPTVSLQGTLSESGQAIDALGLNWSFGVALNWNLFNGLQTTGLYREMGFQRAAVDASLDVQLLQVRVDVESARATIANQKSAVDAAQIAVDAAQQQLQLAEGRLKAGIGTTLELNDAQVLLTQAQSQIVQAQFNLSTARAQLLAALGVSHE